MSTGEEDGSWKICEWVLYTIHLLVQQIAILYVGCAWGKGAVAVSKKIRQLVRFIKQVLDEKRNSIPGISIPLYINHHHLCKSINIIHQNAPSLF
jgi:hypothetical protein